MKRKITWEDESKFEEIKNALRARDTARSTAILKSLSPEEARDVILQDDAKIIVVAIELAYLMIKDHSYKKEEFMELSSIFLNLDIEGFKRGILVATSQIIGRSSLKISPELSVIFKHIDEVSNKQSASKMSIDDVAKTKEDASLAATTANDTSATASLENKSEPHNASIGDDDKLSNTCLAEEVVTTDYTLSEFSIKRIDDKKMEEDNDVYSFADYILNFFFGWLNNLPHDIRESIEQRDSFLALKEHCNEIQAMFTCSKQEIAIIPEEKSSPMNSRDDHVDQGGAANARYDSDNSIDIDNILDISFLAIVPIMTLSGIHYTACDHDETAVIYQDVSCIY